MTFQLAVGEHDFGISYNSRKPGNTSLHLVIEGGKHYCVRLSAKNLTPLVVPIAMVNGKIEQVSCTQAIQEASTYKRIELKRIEPAVRADLDTSSRFPREN